MLSDVGVFFDRDGTINTEVDFLSNPEDLELIPNAGKAIHALNAIGAKVFVITNQSGIARGVFTEAMLHRIHDRLRSLLDAHAARIDKVFYCPHHPRFGMPPYNIECACRKPKTGMLDAAREEFNISLGKSFVVGDRRGDMEAGKKAGCTTILVRTGYGSSEEEDCLASGVADLVVGNIYEAAQVITKKLLHSHAALS